MSDNKVSVAPVSGKRDFDAFVALQYRLNATDPNFVPQLRGEVVELLTPGKNIEATRATLDFAQCKCYQE